MIQFVGASSTKYGAASMAAAPVSTFLAGGEGKGGGT
jgi:hypothetical protein